MLAIWAAPCKKSFGICGHRRPRSACTMVQSDLILCCLPTDIGHNRMYQWRANTHMRLCICTRWNWICAFCAGLKTYFLLAWPIYFLQNLNVSSKDPHLMYYDVQAGLDFCCLSKPRYIFLYAYTHFFYNEFILSFAPFINPYNANHNRSRHHFDFLGYFSEKIRLDISCDFPAWQTIFT